ncbi:TonB-dependent receptor domain-containing protein [Rhodovulum euryhalinum]|uniref:Outer membrane receptor for ferrienterochelin and colicins n=1 Tax=Rhodovulum euryhalinum TaxID=35805 RepID=A0A4R2KN83_9RHOB|nr:TonB-dependent receptor [Rhodovulum euryhalinum]TCO74142.1 outer membrane receptor for ferrienterochelin and colicins [Rhodovulum euryhalinum]
MIGQPNKTGLRSLAGVALGALAGTQALAQEAAAKDSYLGEIVISATGFEQQIADAPATITVISADDLAGKSYAGITDVLDDIPGISIETTGAGKLPGTSSINMRGLGENYVLFLVDGKPVGESQDAYYNGWGGGQRIQTLPPPSAIERIEVVRGPMSALYGSSALGGVINIITKRTADVWSGSLTYGHTLNENAVEGNSAQIDYYLTGPLIRDRLGLTFYGGRNKRDPDDFQGGRSGRERDSNGIKLSWVMTEAQDLDLELRRTVQRTTNDLGNATSDKLVRTTRDDLSLTHRLRWDNGFETTSFLARENVDIDEGNNLSSHSMLTLNSRTLMQFGRHTATAGLEYKLEQTEHDADRFPAGVSDPERWHLSLFGEDDIALTEDFTLTLGARFDDNENYGEHVTPRIYGVYHLNDAFTLKGGISGGYRVPSLKQADSNVGEQSGGNGLSVDQGNSDLKPEESVNYEIGTIWQPRSDLQIGLTAYRTDFKDRIGKTLICDSPLAADRNDVANFACLFEGELRYRINQYTNIDRAEINGIEATLDYRLGQVDISANYTFSDSEITRGANLGEPLNALPRHMFNLGFDWDATDRLNLWTKAKYKSETNEVLSADRTPGYTIVDMGARYRVNDRVDGFLGIYNVFDKKITNDTYGSLLDGRRYYLGLTATF